MRSRARTVPPTPIQTENGEVSARSVPKSSRMVDEVEAELAASRRVLFEASPQPMWVAAEPSGEILDANAAAVTAFGWSATELCGRRADDLVVVDVGTGEVRHLTSSGTGRLVEMTRHAVPVSYTHLTLPTIYSV